MKDVPLNPCRPAEGVSRFTIPLVFPSPDHLHVHVLETADGPLIVDTGCVGSERALRAGLDALDIAPARVLITHGHVDHWGLARLMTDTVLAHPAVLPSLHWGRPTADGRDYGVGAPTKREIAAAFSGFLDLTLGVPDVRPLQDGDRIGAWEVHATPGHDDGHICLFRPEDGVLLCGDLLLPGFTPNVQPSVTRHDTLHEFLASLERMTRLPVRLVLPAHGVPYEDAAGRARELQAHHARRLDELSAALADGPQRLATLRDRVFSGDDLTEADRVMADMETYAHLDHLRRRHSVAFAGERWSLVA